MRQTSRTDRESVPYLLSRALGHRVVSLEIIGSGRNSRVYKLTCDDASRYAVKEYFQHRNDLRDRLRVEFSALSFLWEEGIRCIPRPISADQDHGYGIYEYIEGKPIASAEVGEAEIDFLIDFLIRLGELKNRQGSRRLPNASEACFSPSAIINNIQLRLNHYFELKSNDGIYSDLRSFLNEDFLSLFEEIKKWCILFADNAAISFDAELPFEERTLSPSDLGFHNALWRLDGSLVFLDFEYFGWDDPAKMMSDFLLHPAMELSDFLRARFLAKFLGSIDYPQLLRQRVELVYPLFGLKWVMILLNEFIPAHMLRRSFAGRGGSDQGEIQARQLAKAKKMLDRIRNEYKSFPYRDGNATRNRSQAGQ